MAVVNLLDFLNNENNIYEADDLGLESIDELLINPTLSALFSIDAIDYLEDSEGLEAQEGVLDALKCYDVRYSYIIYGDGEKIRYYMGVIPNNIQGASLVEMQETLSGACEVVKCAYCGNYEKAELTELKGKDKNDIMSMSSTFRYSAVVEAVPPQQDERITNLGINKFQRLMQGRRFMAVVMFQPLDQSMRSQINTDLQQFSNFIAAFASQTRIHQEAKARASSGSVNNNKLHSLTKTLVTTSKQENTPKDEKEAESEDEDEAIAESLDEEDKDAGETESAKAAETSTTTNHNTLNLNSNGCTLNSSVTMTDTCTVLVSQNISILSAVDWQNYIKNVIYERYQYGRDKGLFQYTVNFSVDDMETLHILECAWKNLFQSRKACRVPLKCTLLSPRCCLDKCYKGYRFPVYRSNKRNLGDEKTARCGLCQMVKDNKLMAGHWISSRELGAMLVIPKSPK